jgi:cephalosporin-C deacetylase
MTNFKFLCGPLAISLLLLPPALDAQTLRVTPDHTNGVYEVRQVVRWNIQSKEEIAPAIHYRVLTGGLTELQHGDLSLTNGEAEVAASLSEPGTLLLELKWKTADGQDKRTVAGVVAAPERIGLSAARPKDFDAFWNQKLNELKKIPDNAKLQWVESGISNVMYWKISMDNIRGRHVQGQLARPGQGEKFPALLIVQWAGVYRLWPNWITDRAAHGWLVLDIEAHDIPIDQPESFYKDLSAGTLKDYPSIGNTNRETSYFLPMYLSCYRAADYLTQRPDWNGKTLVVMGGSQGGLQSLMLAGLHPKISAAIADVPAGCDMLGPNVGRSPGWPQWYYSVRNGADAAQIREASRYFDVANFTPHIKCPVLVGLGLIDEVCPPAGVLAALNQVFAPKQLIFYPNGGHQDEHGTHRPFDRERDEVWLPALQTGKSVPPSPTNK